MLVQGQQTLCTILYMLYYHTILAVVSSSASTHKRETRLSLWLIQCFDPIPPISSTPGSTVSRSLPQQISPSDEPMLLVGTRSNTWGNTIRWCIIRTHISGCNHYIMASNSFQCPVQSCQLPIPYSNTIDTAAATIYYIIEHLEDQIDAWIALEYNSIINRCGSHRVIFTNINESQLMELELFYCYIKSMNIQYYTQSIVELRQSVDRFKSLHRSNIVLTDMRTTHELSPDTSSAIQYIVIGGILGDNPPRDRAGYIRDSELFDLRQLGEKQMSSDTAAYVSTLILDHKHTLTELQYIDDPEIDLTTTDQHRYTLVQHNDNDDTTDREFGESVSLPFRYILNPYTRQPEFPPGLYELLIKDSDFSLTDMDGELDHALDEDMNELQRSLNGEIIE